MAATIANADVITALDSVNVALTSNRLNHMFNEIEQNNTDPAVVADAFLNTSDAAAAEPRRATSRCRLARITVHQTRGASTVGDDLDNVVPESFFASLQCELRDRHRGDTRAELARAMFH